MATVAQIQEAIGTTARLMAAMCVDVAVCDAAARAVDACVTALQKGRKVMICGNGGSAADAQHWAGELVSRFNYDRPGLPVIALNTDSAIMTAIGNDYGYERLFSRQIEALGCEGDVLFALSTSGNSPNILAALRAARDKNITTIGFTGRGGGKMIALCDIAIQVPSDATPRIQEGHEVLGHAICGLIEAAIFPRTPL